MIREEITHIWYKQSEVDGCATFVCMPVKIIYKKAKK